MKRKPQKPDPQEHSEPSWLRVFWLMHSLSIVLVPTWVLVTVIWYLLPYGTWWSDFWSSISGGIFGGWILTLLRKWFWEKDATDEPNETVLEELQDIEDKVDAKSKSA